VLGAFTAVREATIVGHGEPCGEPLYAAVPHPRRVPLAAYLMKRYPGVVGLAVIDEAHECTNADSAQSQAMAQFMATKMLLLTGSLSNGYATGLFSILWTISRHFRAEFGRDEKFAFADTFGFRRRTVDYRDKETHEIVAFGTVSDRVERRERGGGYAPGIVPSLFLRYLLRVAVLLHMADMDVELPPLTERVELVDPGQELGARVRRLRNGLMTRIFADRFSELGLAGKLFGAMGEEWSSADRASMGVGNCDEGVYRVCYPEHVGGALVAEMQPFPAEVILPKERRMLEIVRSELAEGRNVLIFAWHANCRLYERLARLVETELGEPCPILASDGVPAIERQAWIKREIVGRGRRVMIVNPAAVGVGLNCLTHFATVVWFQPPGCAPKALRQAIGRIHRIGQSRPCRVYWLIYKGTSQEVLHKLLLLKVAESVAVDALDPASALAASGIGTPAGMSGFDVGRAIFEAAERAAAADVAAAPPLAPVVTLPVAVVTVPVRRRGRETGVSQLGWAF
jgi:hypothetical protein